MCGKNIIYIIYSACSSNQKNANFSVLEAKIDVPDLRHFSATEQIQSIHLKSEIDPRQTNQYLYGMEFYSNLIFKILLKNFKFNNREAAG